MTRGPQLAEREWVYDKPLYRQEPKPRDAYDGPWERVRLPLTFEHALAQSSETYFSVDIDSA